MTEPEWHLWRAFLAALDHGSLSGAARALHQTQPTLGRQIAALENDLGTSLFSFFAHRDYVAAHGLPESVAALGRHTLVGLDDHARRVRPVLGFEAQFGFQCSSDLGLLAALRAGFGIGYCQTGIGLAVPELVPVLPGFVLARVGIWVVMHEDLRAMRRLRALFDHLVGELTRYVEPEPVLAPGSSPR